MLLSRHMRFQFSALVLVVLCGARASAAPELTQDDVDFRKVVYEKNHQTLPYRLFVPMGYDVKRAYPLVLWLHGADGAGSDNVKQLTHKNRLGTHFWISREAQAKFPAFVLAPQAPFGEGWSEPELNQPGKPLVLAMEVLAKVQKEFSIDPDRIYVAGQSMGGLGVWSLLQKYPGRWAAALVLAAYDNFTDVPALARVPLWVFQGDADSSVPVTMVRSMMNQLKKAHADVRYTEYHQVDHEVWNKAFGEPELLSWLSAQARKPPAEGQVGSRASPATR